MLGFALYGLYQKANLFYPPKLNLKTITNQASNNDDEEFYCDKEEMASEVNFLNMHSFNSLHIFIVLFTFM